MSLQITSVIDPKCQKQHNHPKPKQHSTILLHIFLITIQRHVSLQWAI